MRVFLCIFIAICLGPGCLREDPVLSDAPPIAGFGTLTQSVRSDSATTIVLYLTKPVQQLLFVPLETGGAAIRGIDYTLPEEGGFMLQPGATEAFLTITPLPGQQDSGDKFITLTLQQTQGVQLAESRRTMRLNFLNVAHTVQLSLWAKDVAFPQLFGYTSFGPDPVPEGRSGAGEHFCFAYKSAVALNVIGFYNQDTATSTNAFNMHRLYADYNVTSASARIRVPQALRLIPDSPGARTGNVEVIRQVVKIWRTASSGLPPFQVEIWGSGRYNEVTGIIALDVHFNETAIGGPADVLRKYVYEKERRPPQ